MKKFNEFNSNVGTVFMVCEAMVCDSERGCFTDKEKAILCATKEKESSKNDIEIHVYEWNVVNEEYDFIEGLEF
ncbi:MAG: hypothetical protein ACRCX8_11145 [Sarcina sp.]